MMCLVSGASGPETATSPYQYFRRLTFENTGREEILSVILDDGMFRIIQPDLSDLRIFDSSFRELPYTIEQAFVSQTKEIRLESRGRTTNLQELEGNRIELLWVLDETVPPVTELVLETTLRDFEKRVEIDGSPDGQSWTPVAGPVLIFDYSRYMDIQNITVPLPENTFRMFRIRISDMDDTMESEWREIETIFQDGQLHSERNRSMFAMRPFRIERIRGWYKKMEEIQQNTVHVSRPPVSFKADVDGKKKQTVIGVTARNEPLTGIVIETPEKNFSRHYTVEALRKDAGKTDWQKLGEGTLFSLNFRSFLDEQVRMEIPETRAAEYRIVIDNRDNPPLQITGLRLEGPVYRAVWLGNPAEDYLVYFGSESVERPVYEVQSIMGTVRQDYVPVEAVAGDHEENPYYKQAHGTVWRWLESRALFWTATILVALLLGWALFRAGIRVESLDDQK